MSASYSVHPVAGDPWAFLHAVFANGADSLNWLLLSTSGVHGSYLSLDALDDPEYLSEKEPGECDAITFLVIHPRTVGLVYGNVQVTTHAQRAWLRARVAESLAAIATSQHGNVPRGLR